MTSDQTIERDLFGEPIVVKKSRRPKTSFVAAPSTAPSLSEEPACFELFLPERFAFEGNIDGNPIRQIAFKQGKHKGVITDFSSGRVTGIRFTTDDGCRLTIVPKNTKASLGDDPVLLVPGASTISETEAALAQGAGCWLSPRSSKIATLDVAEAGNACAEVLASWKGQFVFREGRPASESVPALKGLRRPQIGALHNAVGHATSSTDPATIVMPTGTGKTETMLAIYAHERIPRLMVVVPTDPLRDQIAGKFETMGLLQEQGCLPPSIKYPIVLKLRHIPKTPEQVEALFQRANVIVTTISIAGRADPAVQERMAQLAGALFIDEAHHISARTWRQFRACFMQAAEKKLIYQFTATPFREDGGKVDGKFIYYYPLAKAQEEGYFGKVEFRAVSEFEGDEADAEIIQQVGAILNRDLADDRNHLAMARCKRISKAKHLHRLYSAAYPHFNPVIVHSEQSAEERRANLEKLKTLESRLIVCVDMLGEGFDLPELKIAALHDVFKSVAATLQFVGRFTRARPDLGHATVIANTDQDRMDRALAKLYAEESDWNLLIATLNADRAGRAMDRAAMFEGFQGDLTDIPLQTLDPNMNAVVFRVRECERWDPHAIEEHVPQGSFVGMKVNERERVAVCVLRHETQARWTSAAAAVEVNWELVLAHWDEENGLLYISSTGSSVSDALARAICGEQTFRIRDQDVFRCFCNFKQLVIRNLGMTHRQGGGTRYSMLMGIDVSDGIDSLKASERIQNNMFGSGFEDGEPRTLGCSVKGKFWSYAPVYDLVDWVAWCHRIGNLATNDSIPSSAAFASAMRPKQINDRPDAHPLVIHWPDSVLFTYEERVEISFGAQAYPITECDLLLQNHDRTGPLKFCVSADSNEAVFEVQFKNGDAAFPQVAGPAASIKMPKGVLPLFQFFERDAPQIDFGDGSFLVYSHHYIPPEAIDLKPLLQDKLIVWDWSGTDIRVEAQGPERRPDSIQYRVVREVLASDYDIVFDDDGSGEFADIIAIRLREGVAEVLLCHCKYASSGEAGARVKDVYEVAGQALKSVQFCHKPKRFLRNMIRRERTRIDSGRPTRFEKGNAAKLRQLYSQWDQYRFQYKLWIVHPGISKNRISDSQMYVLSFVEKALIEHRSIPLQVILSA